MSGNEQERFAKVFFHQILQMEVLPPPLPWKNITTVVIHGLLAVGFASGSDLLLAHAAFGDEIFDCKTGERVTWEEHEDVHIMDEIRLEAEGFGPLRNKRIKMASNDYGGGLTTSTLDGWLLRKFSSWPDDMIILLPDIYRAFFPIDKGTKLIGDSDVLAYGFSETGNCFIIAADNHLYIYARNS